MDLNTKIKIIVLFIMSYVFRLTDDDELVVPEEKEFEEVAAYYDSMIEED